MLLAGCAKEPSIPDATLQPKLVLGERFVPATDEVIPRIEKAQRKRDLIAQGAKEVVEDKPLQEALWIAEALMNYEKGDATRAGTEWVDGAVQYTFEVFRKEDGSVWLNEESLYAGYSNALDQISALVGEGKVYAMDHEIVSVTDETATIEIRWTDKDPTTEIGTPYAPTGIGCQDIDDASVTMTQLLHWNFHGSTPAAFYESLTPFIVVTVNQSVEPNTYGYTCYYGTTATQGGSELLYNGSEFTEAICFPYRWEQLVKARNVLKEHLHLEDPFELIRESVDWAGANVGQIGIPCYPTAYYNQYYSCKVGRQIRR